jgi:hypothetical protein
MQPPSVGMAEAMAAQRTRMRPRDRLLAVLGVCLPVPVFAATGLSLPLPATVERMATELVPFAQPVTPREGGVAGGSIVLTEAERREARARLVVSQTRVAVAPAPPSPPREVAQRRREKPAGRRAGAPRSDDTQSVPVEHPVMPDPAPVALAPLTPPAADRKTEDRHEPKPEPKRERKQAKPKHERESKPKPKEERKPEETPKPPKPKQDSGDEPAAKSRGESAEKDNGTDAGKPSESERPPSR